MRPIDLANQYMDIFFGGGSPEQLHHICHPDMIFQGPFVQFNSAPAYIESLKNDPSREMSYQLLHSYEDESSACLIYQFNKGKLSTPMMQYFETNNGKISRILLIFDGRPFENRQ